MSTQENEAEIQTYTCDSCGAELGPDDIDQSHTVIINFYYCKKCGKRLPNKFRGTGGPGPGDVYAQGKREGGYWGRNN